MAGVRVAPSAAKRWTAGTLKIEKLTTSGATRGRRPRFVRDNAGEAAVLQFGKITGGISAATGFPEADWGSGTVQLYDDVGVADGSPVSVNNRSWDSYPADLVGWFDVSFDPPQLVVIFCTASS
jgi:hypothetical protein